VFSSCQSIHPSQKVVSATFTFKWEFPKTLHACILWRFSYLYDSLFILFLKEFLLFFYVEYFSKKIFYRQLLLRFKREFLKTLHACFFPSHLNVKVALTTFCDGWMDWQEENTNVSYNLINPCRKSPTCNYYSHHFYLFP
jgi:hypothetical protein